MCVCVRGGLWLPSCFFGLSFRLCMLCVSWHVYVCMCVCLCVSVCLRACVYVCVCEKERNCVMNNCNCVNLCLFLCVVYCFLLFVCVCSFVKNVYV